MESRVLEGITHAAQGPTIGGLRLVVGAGLGDNSGGGGEYYSIDMEG